jgi:hypothetical protein
MHNSPTSGIELQLSKDLDCSGTAFPSAKDVRKSLNKYSLLLAPGLLGCLLAYIIYPPLDQGLLVTFGLCAIFLPMVLQLRSILRKRLSEDVGRLRTAYLYSSLALALLALLLLLNGRLDRSPRSLVTTTVVQKKAVRHRSGTQHVLTVSSWRPGRSTEDFDVGSRAFDRAVVGKTATVELHHGYFGLPWSGNVSPE